MIVTFALRTILMTLWRRDREGRGKERGQVRNMYIMFFKECTASAERTGSVKAVALGMGRRYQPGKCGYQF